MVGKLQSVHSVHLPTKPLYKSLSNTTGLTTGSLKTIFNQKIPRDLILKIQVGRGKDRYTIVGKVKEVRNGPEDGLVICFSDINEEATTYKNIFLEERRGVYQVQRGFIGNTTSSNLLLNPGEILVNAGIKPSLYVFEILEVA